MDLRKAGQGGKVVFKNAVMLLYLQQNIGLHKIVIIGDMSCFEG
jgi:hypothetical protein